VNGLPADRRPAWVVSVPLSRRREPSFETKGSGAVAELISPIKCSQLIECVRRVLGAPRPEAGPRGEALPSALAAPAAGASQHERSSQPPRVLLVEDNVVNQKVAMRMLEKLGCSVDVALNGREAVERVRHEEYELVFMDCQMPEMDGFEATSEIRLFEGERAADGAARRTPIVAMTANAMQGDRDACLEAGMDGYIPKPVKERAVRETLERFLGGRGEGPRAEVA
jgi:CheY-like chemotaxis protein